MVKQATLTGGPLHNFKKREIATLQSSLLAWYDANKRVLPWRSIAATEQDPHKRAYAGENICLRVSLWSPWPSCYLLSLNFQ